MKKLLLIPLIGKLMKSSFVVRMAPRLSDAAIIVGTHLLSCIILHQRWGRLQTTSTVLALVLFGVVSEIGGVYRSYREETIASRLGRIWSTWAITVAGLLLIGFMAKVTESFSRLSTMLWFTQAPLMVTSWHAVVGILVRTARTKGEGIRKAVIAGISELSVQLAMSIHEKPWLGIDIIGHFDDRDKSRRPESVDALGPYLGRFDELVEQAEQGAVDVVYIALPMRAEIRINELVRRLGLTTASVYLAQSFGGFSLLPQGMAPRWSQVGNVSVLGIVESPYRGILGAVKQFEDMLLGSVFLGIAAIPMVIIAIAIKLTSKGPVFFRQTRYGLCGEPIKVLKFRSMTVAEDGAEVRQATKNDKRVTPLGAFLRRTSLDELPQFIHVVTGKMSLVGPRPHAVAHNEQYRKHIDYYMVRHKVKPGITGWAQVNGWRGETDTDEKMKKRVEHDLAYIRNWSPYLDLKIIFLTVFGRKTHRDVY